jgi:hypothetical protein
MGNLSGAARTHNKPFISSIRTMVPEEHPSMTTPLKHLEAHKTPSGTHVPF